MKKNFNLIGLLMPLTALILSGCTLDKLNLSSENFSYTKSSTETPGLRYEIVYSDEALRYIIATPNMGFVGSRITLYTRIVYDADLVFCARNYFDLDEILFYLEFSCTDDNWEYSFTMPAYPIYIDCFITGGM